ncbi:hypothetical protein BDW02DRAFT_297770 [Decorospora gaudefroyi]|uniref:Uncharacterized protein n=1 Tax=Decorospora gaudefroyi TaxID=184978 RepID=A0A6A5JW28_9PLEO|nr:hypothetical protein BDW02DRAFT_297770 [Decorospora gaudefroyi]
MAYQTRLRKRGEPSNRSPSPPPPKRKSRRPSNRSLPERTCTRRTRDDTHSETYPTWPPEKGTFHYLRVKNRRDGEDETHKNFVIVQIDTCNPLTASQLFPAPKDSHSWMTPPDERLANTTAKWLGLEKENFDGPAQINSMPERALGKQGMFIRDSRAKINTTCASCKKDLQAIDYSHCLDCKTYVHNECVAPERCPLQIIGTELCNNDGTPIACPGCGGVKTIKAVDVPVTKDRPGLSILFDFGSERTESRSVYTNLHKTSTGCRWMTHGICLLDQHEAQWVQPVREHQGEQH